MKKKLTFRRLETCDFEHVRVTIRLALMAESSRVQVGPPFLYIKFQEGFQLSSKRYVKPEKNI